MEEEFNGDSIAVEADNERCGALVISRALAGREVRFEVSGKKF